jgi:polysaccharide biosynthesis/export protein
MSVRLKFVAVSSALLLSGCAHFPGELFSSDMTLPSDEGAIASSEGSIKDGAPIATADGYPVPVTSAEALPPVQQVAWGEPAMPPHDLQGPHAVADTDGPYLLDSGDRLRIFVYGQPNLSRLYIVDHDGKIAVPLIGEISARGKTTSELQGTIRARLGAEFVKDPQVTVDVQQNRPFFILGEVKNAGQFPYISGMTVETAVAIAGGYTERASTRKYRITRRINGLVEQIEAPGDYVVKAGDTVHVFERFF